MSRNKLVLEPDTEAMKFTYGIEIETTVPKQKRMNIGTYSTPKQLRGCPQGWMTKTDSSIFSGRENKGVEVVSPVLQGLDGIEQIEQVTQKLSNVYDATCNDSCGFHVHVGLPQACYNETGYDKEAMRKFVKNLVSWVGRYELALYASTGNITRVGNTYCKSVISEYDLNQLCGKDGMSYLENNFQVHAKRYSILNVINLFNNYRPDTVEFRVFAGTIDATKIISYIQIALGMSIKALKGGFNSFNKKSNEGRKTGIGRTQVDIMMESFHWNKTTPTVGLGWIAPTEWHSKVVSQLRQSADAFDKQVDSRCIEQRPILKKWYKEN